MYKPLNKKPMMKKIAIIAVSVLMIFSSCDSYTTTGAMMGGMLGSAVGGLAGGYRGSDVGLLVGAAAGAAIGASAREAEISRAQQRYHDEVYNTSYRPRDEKAERVARYHANTKAKYSGSRGYRLTRDEGQRTSGTAQQSRGYQQSMDYQQSPDKSGYTEKAQYDDRIDFK